MAARWQDETARLAREGQEQGRAPSAWFEDLWSAGDRGDHALPWEDEEPNRVLAEWVAREDLRGEGRGAVVVGAGLGREAALLVERGFATTAFDVAPTAVRLAAERVPEASFVVADLFDLPAAWAQAFDLVVEVYTVQALPRQVRSEAVAALSSLVAAGGTLLVVQAVADPDDPDTTPPWRLDEAEVRSFADHGLDLVRLERLEAEGLGGWRWRAELRRPTARG